MARDSVFDEEAMRKFSDAIASLIWEFTGPSSPSTAVQSWHVRLADFLAKRLAEDDLWALVPVPISPKIDYVSIPGPDVAKIASEVFGKSRFWTPSEIYEAVKPLVDCCGIDDERGVYFDIIFNVGEDEESHDASWRTACDLQESLGGLGLEAKWESDNETVWGTVHPKRD